MNAKELQIHRQERLQALVETFNGYAAMGRTMGYRDGAYISQMCKGLRPITESFVMQAEALPGYTGWFSLQDTDNVFSAEVSTAIKKLHPERRKRMENLLRSALDLPLLR